jgi:nucleotide-binding universal stress UspA family protein
MIVDTTAEQVPAIEARLRQICSRHAASQRIGVTARVVVGTPYDRIVEMAKSENADLIVIATHGYTGLKHFYMGSTAERVVRHAPCPVLVVREKERDFVPVKKRPTRSRA